MSFFILSLVMLISGLVFAMSNSRSWSYWLMSGLGIVLGLAGGLYLMLRPDRRPGDIIFGPFLVVIALLFSALCTSSYKDWKAGRDKKRVAEVRRGGLR